MRLIFVRHGEPNYEKDCLTKLGHEEAKAAAQRLLCENIDEIFSSPMGRAMQTAEAYAALTGKKEIKVLDFMHEIRYGREEALYEDKYNPWTIADQLISEGKNLQDDKWPEFPLYKDNTATIDIKKIGQEADKWLKSLGYEREGLYYRNKGSAAADKTLAIFCHGGSTTAFLSRVLNQQFPYLASSLHLPHTGITILRFDRKEGSLAAPIVELASDGTHIKELLSQK